jgi:Ca2+-binding EF-hand superfamily protein
LKRKLNLKKNYLLGQNPTEDEILELVLEADTNGDGTIDFQVSLPQQNICAF